MNLKEAELLWRADALEIPVIKQHDQSEGWTFTLAGRHELNPILETARLSACVQATGRGGGRIV